MCARVGGSAGGRVRAYVAQPQVDSKSWLQDDYIYSTSQPPTGAAAKAVPKPTAGSDGPADAWASVRIYDDTLLMTWRLGADGVGRLWAGAGSDATDALWADGQGQRALVHLIGSKHRRPLRGLVTSTELLHAAAHMSELHITTRGLIIGIDDTTASGGRLYTWFSGAFPMGYATLRAADVRTAVSRIAALGKPRVEGALSIRIDSLLPCVHSAHATSPPSAQRDGDTAETTAVMPARLGLIACAAPRSGASEGRSADGARRRKKGGGHEAKAAKAAAKEAKEAKAAAKEAKAAAKAEAKAAAKSEKKARLQAQKAQQKQAAAAAAKLAKPDATSMKVASDLLAVASAASRR